jgi:urease gamma subunit
MSSIVPFPQFPLLVRHLRFGSEAIPKDLSRAELIRYFTYSDDDKREISQCRCLHNQIGFATLLGGVRLTGRFPYNLETIPRSIMTHVCGQLGLEIPLFLAYPQRRQTRHEHVERMRVYLGLRTFRRQDRALIIQHVRERVRAGARLHALLESTEQMLREQSIVLPGVTVLERLIGSARTLVDEEIYQDLGGRIDSITRQKILALLQVSTDEKITPFQQLQLAGHRQPRSSVS